MAIIGIDLGTTNSLAVVYRQNTYELIPNCYNEYLTPSVVSIDEDGTIIVGKRAKQRLVTHPETTTSLFKRKMGKKTKIRLTGYSYLPEELSAFVVKQLMEDAKTYLGEDIDEIVISVPAYFDEFQREATKRIGDLLGVKVERLINEPSAAALACHLNYDKDEAFIVFDFGGGTLDVSVVDCFDNVISICAIAGDNQLGGSDFDRVIANDFCVKNKLDIDDLSKMHQESLLLRCEELKMNLQDKEKVETSIYIDEKEYHYTLTKEALAEMSVTIFDKIKRIVAKAVNDSNFESSEIDKMILVGGSCHMPIVIEYLMKLMNLSVTKIENMDMVVACGLGTYLGIKQRNESVRDLVLTDICPFSLGVNTHNYANPLNPLFSVIIPKNSVLPTSKTQLYQTVEKGQTQLDLIIYQGEEIYANDNKELEKLEIKIPKNLEQHEAISVTFSYDINSLLCIDVEVLSNRNKYQCVISGHETSQAQIKAIKNISMNINLEPDVEYIRERINRLLLESSTKNQEIIRDHFIRFETLLKENNQNLRIKTQIIKHMKDNLDSLEKDTEKCDFFSDFDNDESGGFLA